METLEFNEEEPITVSVHPSLVEELKERQRQIVVETGRKCRGGITTFSRLAAMELRLSRESGHNIMEELKKIGKSLEIKRIDNREYVPYEFYKNLYIFSSALMKKKDHKQIRVEVSKIKGMQKNEVEILW
jgi:hypothetical protein